MEAISFKTIERKTSGTSGARLIRKEGLIPAVMYGGGEVSHFAVKLNDVKKLIYTPDFKLAEVDVEGTTHRCIIKALQIHPVTDNIEHIDFLRLIDGHPIKVDIPIKFKGTSPGEKEGGKLVQMMRRVKVKTTPENLVSELFVDISELKLGFSVRVNDIEVNDNLEVLSVGATPVANVEVPRALKSEQAAEGDEVAVSEEEAETAPAE